MVIQVSLQELATHELQEEDNCLQVVDYVYFQDLKLAHVFQLIGIIRVELVDDEEEVALADFSQIRDVKFEFDRENDRLLNEV